MPQPAPYAGRSDYFASRWHNCECPSCTRVQSIPLPRDPSTLDQTTLENIFVALRWIVFPRNKIYLPKKQLDKLPYKLDLIKPILHSSTFPILAKQLTDTVKVSDARRNAKLWWPYLAHQFSLIHPHHLRAGEHNLHLNSCWEALTPRHRLATFGVCRRAGRRRWLHRRRSEEGSITASHAGPPRVRTVLGYRRRSFPTLSLDIRCGWS